MTESERRALAESLRDEWHVSATSSGYVFTTDNEIVADCIGLSLRSDYQSIAAHIAEWSPARVVAVLDEMERLRNVVHAAEAERDAWRTRSGEQARTIKNVMAQRDVAEAHREATNKEIKKLHAIIKSGGFSVEDSVALHEFKSAFVAAESRLAEMVAALRDHAHVMDGDDCSYGPVLRAIADQFDPSKEKE